MIYFFSLEKHGITTIIRLGYHPGPCGSRAQSFADRQGFAGPLTPQVCLDTSDCVCVCVYLRRKNHSLPDLFHQGSTPHRRKWGAMCR